MAASLGLTSVSEKGVYMGVDMSTQSDERGRRSVRIQSKEVYNGGLFVIRIEHAPTGCGSWPAFWMYGEDPQHPWPSWGEYDIIETIHTASQAMTSLHTTEHCDQSGVVAGLHFSRTWRSG